MIFEVTVHQLRFESASRRGSGGPVKFKDLPPGVDTAFMVEADTMDAAREKIQYWIVAEDVIFEGLTVVPAVS